MPNMGFNDILVISSRGKGFNFQMAKKIKQGKMHR